MQGNVSSCPPGLTFEAIKGQPSPGPHVTIFERISRGVRSSIKTSVLCPLGTRNARVWFFAIPECVCQRERGERTEPDYQADSLDDVAVLTQLRSLVRETPAMLPQVLQGLASQSPVSQRSGYCSVFVAFCAVVFYFALLCFRFILIEYALLGGWRVGPPDTGARSRSPCYIADRLSNR